MRVRRSVSGVSLDTGDDLRLLIEERLPSVTNSRIKRHRHRNTSWVVGALAVMIVVSLILLVSCFRELTTSGDYDPSPLSERQIRVDGSSVYKIGVVSDLDHDSLHSSGKKWISYFKKGELVVSADLKNVSIRWSDNNDIILESEFAAGGRAMELSDLVVFNHRLLTIDDRTGLIYEGEWMTVKDDELWIGGLGKEWSTPQGDFINDHPMWVKVVDRTGRARCVSWADKYKKLRTAAGIKAAGYMVHESVQWSPFHRKWFFLPRRASSESYNDVDDEKRGTNMLIDASEDFESISVTRVGQAFYEGTRGFSAFQFLPHTDDSLVIALKSEEIGMDQAGHHGHHGNGVGGHMAELNAFMSSLEENATAAAKSVVDAVTGANADDHHVFHGHHAVHGPGDHDDHNMMMYFHGGCKEVILFDFWRVSTWSGLFFSCFLIFIMGAAYEGVKWFRVYLQLQQSASQKCPRENGVHLHESIPLHCQEKKSASTEDVYNPTTTPPSAARTHVKRSSPFSSNSPFALPRLIQAFLYILQLVLAYWLMLVAMTYNTYLTSSVILGAGFGHWLFAVLKFRNPLGETADSFATDACH